MKRRVFLLSAMTFLSVIWMTIGITYGSYVADTLLPKNGLSKNQVEFEISDTDGTVKDLYDYLHDKLSGYCLLKSENGRYGLLSHNRDFSFKMVNGRSIKESDSLDRAIVYMVRSGIEDDFVGEVVGTYIHEKNLASSMGSFYSPLYLEDRLYGSYCIDTDLDKKELKSVLKGYSGGVTIHELGIRSVLAEAAELYFLPVELLEMICVFIVVSLIYIIRMWRKQYDSELHIRWLCGAPKTNLRLRVFVEYIVITMISSLFCTAVACMKCSDSVVLLSLVCLWLLVHVIAGFIVSLRVE